MFTDAGKPAIPQQTLLYASLSLDLKTVPMPWSSMLIAQANSFSGRFIGHEQRGEVLKGQQPLKMATKAMS